MLACFWLDRVYRILDRWESVGVLGVRMAALVEMREGLDGIWGEERLGWAPPGGFRRMIQSCAYEILWLAVY